MKSVLFVIALLPLVFCAPRRDVKKQKRTMQSMAGFNLGTGSLSDSGVTSGGFNPCSGLSLMQTNLNMGTSISYQLDNLLQDEQPDFSSRSGGMSGGFNPGLGSLSGSGGMSRRSNPCTGSLSGFGGSSGGFNPGTGSLSGSGGSSGGLNPGTGSLSGSDGSSGGFNTGIVHIPQYKQVDFLLVLDSSGSVGSDAFDDGKTAAKTIIRYIDNRSPIQHTGSRVGLIEYSSTSLTSFAFHIGTYNMLWDVLSAVDRVTYDSGPATATAVALRQAKAEIEQHDNTNNRKLVWIVTDGHSNEGGNPIPVADQLKAMGVKICAVGIGTSINRVEINGMASPNCAFYPTNFDNYVHAAEYALALINGTANNNGTDFFKGIQFGKK